MTQHTQGKHWKPYTNKAGQRFVITNGNGGISKQDCKASYIDTDENARLIAAAPELLEALIELDQAFQAAIPTHCEYPQGTFEIVQAVIAKARGQS